MISAINDFFNQREPNTATMVEEVWGLQKIFFDPTEKEITFLFKNFIGFILFYFGNIKLT